jgi:hypothetical protein
VRSMASASTIAPTTITSSRASIIAARHRAKCANDANGRFKRALTTQALGFTWFGHNAASSSRCSAARRRRGRSRQGRNRRRWWVSSPAIRSIVPAIDWPSPFGGSQGNRLREGTQRQDRVRFCGG